MTARVLKEWQDQEEVSVLEYDYPDEQVTYPKISVGDTVFAIEWIQSLFRIEDKGVCLYSNLPPLSESMMVGLFRMSSKFEHRPLHIFMPGGSRTERVTRLNPSYDDIESNVEIDGYYDRVRDCIVLTGHVDLVTRWSFGNHRLESPVINKPELVFEMKDKPWSIYYKRPAPRMIIQLAGCARVEQVDPLIVGDFIGTKCEDKLLESYNSKTGFGSEDRDIKSEVWNILPGPISEEINYNIGLEDAERIYSLIDPKKNRTIAGFEFKRTSKGPEITFYDTHDKNIGFMKAHTSQRHRIRVIMQWMDDYRDRIVNAPNTRIVICKVMEKLIQHHPEMNRTSESEMRKLEACSRG